MGYEAAAGYGFGEAVEVGPVLFGLGGGVAGDEVVGREGAGAEAGAAAELDGAGGDGQL